MIYRRLGRSGLQVSRLCLGSVNFGWLTDPDESFAIMDAALENGVNFLDTADRYGHSLGDNSSESIIGRWLSQGGTRRERVVLATKVYCDLSDWPNDGKLSARHIRHACEASLRRLRTDHIDLYQMHHVDRSTPWEEVWQAMDLLVRQGKILYVGSSNFAAWHIATADSVARQRQLLGIMAEQSLYNLTQRMVELEVLPACEALGVGVLAYSPLAEGLLAGRGGEGEAGRREQPSLRARLESRGDQLTLFEALCKDLGEEPASVALAWVLRHPAVVAPVVGARTRAQLLRSLRALEILFEEETLAKLDAIWPGPGGAAPEAYAW
jgi:aryl-alcohol dehydrogenase-like predicted oxidoreductase